MNPKAPTSQITFLYFTDMQPADDFFSGLLGLETVEEQSFARIYRVSEGAFVGAVSGERGFHRPQEKNAVLVTLLVNDIEVWFDKISAAGLKIVRPLMEHKDINIRCFFFEGPGGYSFEIQEFLDPRLREIFH
jgi:predicted enzyme related to lactoylglutathione lyase